MKEKFIKSWDEAERFYAGIQIVRKEEILGLIRLLRSKGFDKSLRAGTSLFSLVLSRSIQHGLRPEQRHLAISFVFIKSVMEVRTWHETKNFDEIAYYDYIDARLKQLVQEPID